PGETSDDVIKTIELLDRIRGYRSIIVPMFFVPMGSMKERRWFIKDNLKKEHVDALIRMYEHTVFWAEDIINNYYLKNPASYPVRFLLKYFIRYVKKQVNKYIKIIEENIRQ
ncbi:MAG: radical SAM protein, partial [Thermosphaera sp.]